MPANAVGQYVKSQLDNQTVAGRILAAHVQPPPSNVTGKNDDVSVYIWPGRIKKIKQTMGPFFQLQYTPLSLVIRQTIASDEASLATFPRLVDAVQELITAIGTAMPQPHLHDPDTGEESYITKIGEQIDIDFSYRGVIMDPRPVTVVCTMGVSVWEQVAT